MSTTDQEFLRRVLQIPHHGLGLSVDVYQPDLFSLLSALEAHGLSFGYLEVFKASTQALREVRRRVPSVPLEYHAEGLWVTQPDFLTRYPVAAEVAIAVEHVRTLGSWWANYEGATKEMAGYSFGTYLPPLFTQASVEVTAGNIAWVQEQLDRSSPIRDGLGPLFLLETPPLTYFGFGDFDMAEFFRRVADRVPCGIVLDVGHLWTVYRYSEDHRHFSLEHFLRDFLDHFPLERVVHIHAAGLAIHDPMGPSSAVATSPSLPWWIDSHGAPIPEVLFDMLAQVLSHPRLIQAKGLALEVDTKAIAHTIEEFRRFQQRFKRWSDIPAPTARTVRSSGVSSQQSASAPCESIDRQQSLLEQYRTYVQVVTDRAAAETGQLPTRWLEPDALALYRDIYLPNEILHWGGDLRAMFPETCSELEHACVGLNCFVDYWFREPQDAGVRYDFFELKLIRFTAFVREILPRAAACVEREAEILRSGYHEACNKVTSEE